MKHITLLMRCHALLRRVDTVTPEGRLTLDGDRLAKEITDYITTTVGRKGQSTTCAPTNESNN
jgi:hypothetical protein